MHGKLISGHCCSRGVDIINPVGSEIIDILGEVYGITVNHIVIDYRNGISAGVDAAYIFSSSGSWLV